MSGPVADALPTRIRRNPQPSEDEAEVVADGGEMTLAPSPFVAFEVAAAEVTFGFHVADHDSNGGATSELGLDGADDATLLARDEDAARVW